MMQLQLNFSLYFKLRTFWQCMDWAGQEFVVKNFQLDKLTMKLSTVLGQSIVDQS
jgi:hypothetical protein